MSQAQCAIASSHKPDSGPDGSLALTEDNLGHHSREKLLQSRIKELEHTLAAKDEELIILAASMEGENGDAYRQLQQGALKSVGESLLKEGWYAIFYSMYLTHITQNNSVKVGTKR
jgi:hypothetical protein